MTYRREQLESQRRYLLTSNAFSPDARRGGGVFRGKARDFVLPSQFREENLFRPIRDVTLKYFSDHKISWHVARAHLLSSQAFCLNFLAPFAFQPQALRTLLQGALGFITEMLEVEPETDPKRLVAFEFIGNRDYLNEATKSRRTRGANCTSPDAFVRFITPSGGREAALVEWKYTESYSRTKAEVRRNGVRLDRYRHIAIWENGPLRSDCGVELVEFFNEPIYQLLRLQMLAKQMEKDSQLGIDRVRVVLIAPRANLELHKLKIEGLRRFGIDVSSAWKALLHDSDRFVTYATEDLFRDSRVAPQHMPDLAAWHSYIGERYSLF